MDVDIDRSGKDCIRFSPAAPLSKSAANGMYKAIAMASETSVTLNIGYTPD
jgi:hypothetical protein